MCRFFVGVIAVKQGGDKRFFLCAFLKELPQKCSGIIQTDHPVKTFCRFSDGDHNLLTGDFPEKKVLFDFHSCLPGEHYAASRSKWYFFACVQMLCSTPIVR